jgi:hypothetical protein
MENLRSGFYKMIDGEPWYAPNAVFAPNYTLKKEEKDSIEFPVDGWMWFDSEQEAYEHFNYTSEQTE